MKLVIQNDLDDFLHVATNVDQPWFRVQERPKQADDVVDAQGVGCTRVHNLLHQALTEGSGDLSTQLVCVFIRRQACPAFHDIVKSLPEEILA